MVSLYFGVMLNLPIFLEFLKVTEGNPSVGILFLITIPITLVAAFNIIYSVFAFPYIVKPIIITLLVTSSLASFATLNYGTIFDLDMIENILQTDSSEAGSYYSSKALIYFIFTGLLPSVWVLFAKLEVKDSIFKEILSRVCSVLLSIVVILTVCAFFYKDYSSIGRNNKYMNMLIVPSHAYSSYKYIKKNYFVNPIEYKQVGTDAKILPAKNGKPTLTIFVLGETARSANISYNGYERNTNPYTLEDDLISFQDTESCGTATAHSVPCMFSSLNRNNYKKRIAKNSDNFINVLQHAGVSTLWIENDGGSKGVDKRTPSITIDRSEVNEFCDGNSCHDGVMLKDLKDRIDSIDDNNDLFKQKNPNGDKFVAIHLMGSHGPTYWKRYPKEIGVFSPTCDRADIENCSDTQITNTYDNTIVYTDSIIHEAISILKDYSSEYNVALIYLSDHGESLGENGIYLHGYPYSFSPDEQRHVPFYLWMSDDFISERGINENCLRDIAKNSTVSHDNLFHTVLGMGGVISEAINPDLDLIQKCKS